MSREKNNFWTVWKNIIQEGHRISKRSSRELRNVRIIQGGVRGETQTKESCFVYRKDTYGTIRKGKVKRQMLIEMALAKDKKDLSEDDKETLSHFPWTKECFASHSVFALNGSHRRVFPSLILCLNGLRTRTVEPWIGGRGCLGERWKKCFHSLKSDPCYAFEQRQKHHQTRL